MSKRHWNKREKEIKEEIRLARQCMDYQGIKCKNKTCLNEFCPLNIKN